MDSQLTQKIRANRLAAVNRRLEREFIAGDNFYHPGTWPNFMKNNLFNHHKKHKDRFKLWRFLYYNGMPPRLAAHFTLYHGRFGYPYDKPAIEDLRAAVKIAEKPRNMRSDAEIRTVERWNNYPIFDMEEMKVMYGPHEERNRKFNARI
jgi:hypothetical protein